MKTLTDFGEKMLVRRISRIAETKGLPPLLLDDCATVDPALGEETIVATADPSPIPNLTQKIGLGDDYSAGWLCAIKSLSDIAAVGAKPLGVVAAVEFPAETKLSQFDLYFVGLCDALAQYDCSLIAGNIKEGKKPHGVAFALGKVRKDRMLLRGTVEANDRIMVVGSEDLGGFWAGVGSYLKGQGLAKGISAKAEKMACKPTPKIREGMTLSAYLTPHFCMDTSDGLLSCLQDMLVDNIDVEVDLTSMKLPTVVEKVARNLGADPWLWAFLWGGYQLVCVVPEVQLSEVEATLDRSRIEYTHIGLVRRGKGRAFLVTNKGNKRILFSPFFTCEQFRKDSFWQSGAKKYIEFAFSNTLQDAVVRSG